MNFVDQMMAVEAYENGDCTAYDRFDLQTAWRNSKTLKPPYLSSPIDAVQGSGTGESLSVLK